MALKHPLPRLHRREASSIATRQSSPSRREGGITQNDKKRLLAVGRVKPRRVGEVQRGGLQQSPRVTVDEATLSVDLGGSSKYSSDIT